MRFDLSTDQFFVDNGQPLEPRSSHSAVLGPVVCASIISSPGLSSGEMDRVISTPHKEPPGTRKGDRTLQQACLRGNLGECASSHERPQPCILGRLTSQVEEETMAPVDEESHLGHEEQACRTKGNAFAGRRQGVPSHSEEGTQECRDDGSLPYGGSKSSRMSARATGQTKGKNTSSQSGVSLSVLMTTKTWQTSQSSQ